MHEVENFHLNSIRSSANGLSVKQEANVEGSSPTEINEERSCFQDCVITANYNYQIEQLQLKHAQAMEESQFLINQL